MSQEVKKLPNKNTGEKCKTNLHLTKQNVNGIVAQEQKNVNKIESKQVNIRNTKHDLQVHISKLKSAKMCEGKDEISLEGEMAFDNPLSKADKAMLSVLSAQVKSLKEEVGKLVDELVSKDDIIMALQKHLKEAETHITELQNRNTQQEKSVAKLQKALDDTTKKCDATIQELNSTKFELENLTRIHKTASTISSNLEKKLTQNLAYNEKLKKELSQCKESGKTQQECAQRKIEDLTSKNKNLQKQNADFHDVIKKQMQLLNNLKRQKMHAEAAISLKFTEEEFMKALDTKPIFDDI